MVAGNQTRKDVIRYDNMNPNRGGNAAGLALGVVFLFVSAIVLLLWYSSGFEHKSMHIPTAPADDAQYQPFPKHFPGQR